MKRGAFLSVFAALLALPALASGQANVEMASLASLSIEELMDIPVVSVSKEEQTRRAVAAAVYVITNDDIRRSGARSIPEALRLAPGMEVSHINQNQYAITARGQNHLFADKLLVMLDGRPVYSTSFSGVWWAAFHYPLEDIERIEVIRGPGAAMWGSNAVNGVINIITYRAARTLGGYADAGAGSEERWFADVRYGKAMQSGAWRVYGMGSEHDGGRFMIDPWGPDLADGGDTEDQRAMAQGGFRADWGDRARGMTLQGDAYHVTAGAEGAVMVIPGDTTRHFEVNDHYTGGNLYARGHHDDGGPLAWSAHAFYDRAIVEKIFFSETRDTLDAEGKLDWRYAPGHTFSLGANYRFTARGVENTQALTLSDEDLSLFSLYAQNQSVFADRLHVTLSARAEQNQYTGWEFQPNARAAWVDEERGFTLWAAAARSVRLPTVADNGIILNLESWSDGDFRFVGRVVGDGRAVSEEMISQEAGLRLFPAKTLAIDVAAYYNRYRDIVDVSHAPGDPVFEEIPPPPHYVGTAYQDNVYQGDTYGFEVLLDWNPAPWARLAAGYAYTRLHLNPKPENLDDESAEIAGWLETSSPPHAATGRLFLNLPGNVELDTLLYYVDRMDGLGVPKYLRLDARFGMKLTDQWSVSVTGRNLLQPIHHEFEWQWIEEGSFTERDVTLQVTWRQ